VATRRTSLIVGPTGRLPRRAGDPDTWTEPWTAEVPLRRLDGEL
jgi:hypothetical protein